MATKAVQNTQETVQENPVEEAVEVVSDPHQEIINKLVFTDPQEITNLGAYGKPVFEYVRVDTFLPVPLEVGKQAYVRVLGEHDTKEMISTVPVFTQPVIAITEDGFETDDAIYKEI